MDEPECNGKANMFYGLYRTEALRSVISDIWSKCDFSAWGGDHVFLFAFLSRFPVVGSDEVLLHKRMQVAVGEPAPRSNPRTSFVSGSKFRSYLDRHKIAAPGEIASKAVSRLLWRRLLRKKTAQVLMAVGL